MRLFLFVLALIFVTNGAKAQDQATVVASCGSVTLTAGTQHFRTIVSACGSMAPLGALTAGGQSFPTIDVNGRLCLTAVVDAMRDNALEARLKKLEERK